MEDYVENIGDRSVEIVACIPSNIMVIKGLGGASIAGRAGSWRIDYDTEDQLARILQALRDADLTFAGGPSGWPPAAVAEMLRDKGKLHGTIREASWSGPNQQVVRDR